MVKYFSLNSSIYCLFIGVLFFMSCDASHLDANTIKGIKEVTQKEEIVDNNQEDSQRRNIETAIIGGGCFWCTEAQYLALQGVVKVISGYAGGRTENPTYQEVSTGSTGHAEVIKIEFDTSLISYADILEAFFIAHDPTQLNRQGADVGTQYRSTIMPLDNTQKKTAERIIKDLNDQNVFSHEVVTVVEKYDQFYPAEDYHQNYYANNKGKNPYCSRTVGPKLDKFKKVFKDKLKKN